VARVKLESGGEIEGRTVLSSAGLPETMRLCGQNDEENAKAVGQLSFCETIATLNVQPRDIRHEKTITFYNDWDQFAWRKPDAPCDLRSGVICSPNNFQYDEPLGEGTIRITALANYEYWNSLDNPSYRLDKLRWYDRIAASAVRFIPDFRRHVVDTDMFTPTTITRFTGRAGGAVYGAPQKRFDGRTHLDNLFLCGTDQGFVGIVGSLLSGITMANRWCLR
jgi:phytoene dehydrogenase-like protein